MGDNAYLSSNDHKHPAGKHGFTLVELLVVIGIIAVLISILLPALAKAQQQAKAVACQSNLRQIGQVLYNYLDDNKGVGYIGTLSNAAFYTPPTGFTFVGYNWWFLQLKETATGITTYDYTKGYLTQYMQDTRVIDCPALGDDQKDNNGLTSPPSSTLAYIGTAGTSGRIRNAFDYNGTFALSSPTTANRLHSFSQITKPTQTWALCEAMVNVSGNYSVGGTVLTTPTYPYLHGGRHGGTANVLWYDGHVTAEAPYIPQLQSSIPSAYRSQIPTYTANGMGYLTPFTPGNPPETSVFPLGSSKGPAFYYFWENKDQMQ